MSVFCPILAQALALICVLSTSLALYSSEAIPKVALPVSGNKKTPKTVGLDDIKPMVSKLLDEHVSQKNMTPELAVRAHERFLTLFDPFHIYLLDEEVSSFIGPQAGVRYMREWKENSFSSFVDMIRLIHKAIQRSRGIREHICTMPKERMRKALRGAEDIWGRVGEQSWPRSKKELIAKQEAYVLKKADDGLKTAGKGSYTAQQSFEDKEEEAVRSVDRSMRKEEKDWLFVYDDNRELPHLEIEAMLAQRIMKAYGMSLDAHSTVFNESEAKKLKERLSKQVYGTGIICEVQNGTKLVIKKIIPRSPAAALRHLHVGDTVLSVNDIAAHRLIEAPERLENLLGDAEESPTVTLKIQSGSGSNKELRLIVHKGHFSSDEGRLDVERIPTGRGTAYILKLHSFYASEDESVSSESDMRQALEQIRNECFRGKGGQPPLGIVLDLRDNRGGYLLQAVKVAGLFIRSGVVVVAQYSNGAKKAFRDLDPGVAYTGPLIVLTSKCTASAAEIVAQALQDYGVALIVGDEKTYGKGSIQMQTATEGKMSQHPETETYFKVTVGQYYSVAGESLQLQGVRADIVVPSMWANQRIGEEFLDCALPRQKQISESFDDSLGDVSQNQKEWMSRYYIPFLQKPKRTLARYIPDLRSRSRKRMAVSPRWQAFQSGNYSRLGELLRVSPDDIAKGVEAMQLQEAVFILEDLSEISHEPISMDM